MREAASAQTADCVLRVVVHGPSLIVQVDLRASVTRLLHRHGKRGASAEAPADPAAAKRVNVEEVSVGKLQRLEGAPENLEHHARSQQAVTVVGSNRLENTLVTNSFWDQRHRLRGQRELSRLTTLRPGNEKASALTIHVAAPELAQLMDAAPGVGQNREKREPTPVEVLLQPVEYLLDLLLLVRTLVSGLSKGTLDSLRPWGGYILPAVCPLPGVSGAIEADDQRVRLQRAL
tara:strand:+ start:483 stop:1181 length:699 start_codon:yes stop_codon:yes gene_type:complete